nr:DUF2203 family protein [Cohnella sp. CFH 77786]
MQEANALLPELRTELRKLQDLAARFEELYGELQDKKTA